MSGLPDLPPLREVIARHNLRAEKKLGQNFLLDANITDKIVRAAGPLDGLSVIEIGPGPGGLTRSILKAGPAGAVAIEYDPRAIEALQDLVSASSGRLTVVHADALETDLRTLTRGRKRAIIANLPYNIATPLILNWLQQLREDSGCYQSMTLMVQREVADRMTARPGTKAYGRLSIPCQWLCDVKRMFDVPPSAFVPPPKVTSSIVQFIPKTPQQDMPGFATVEKITAAAFGQRRKMLRSSMKNYLESLKALGIDETARAGDLDVGQFIALARQTETP